MPRRPSELDINLVSIRTDPNGDTYIIFYTNDSQELEPIKLTKQQIRWIIRDERTGEEGTIHNLYMPIPRARSRSRSGTRRSGSRSGSRSRGSRNRTGKRRIPSNLAAELNALTAASTRKKNIKAENK
jgi:hypothetical protein